MAMSTISQLGYMVAAAGALAAPAALYHLVTHAAFKALLFLTAGTVAHALGGLDLRQLSGLWRRHRLAAISLLVGGAALAGLPPLSGGLSKELLVAGVWAHAPTAGVLLLAGSALTAFYVGRMWAIVLPSGAAATAANPHHDHGHGSGSDGPMSLGLALLLAGTLLLGLLQTPILNAVAGHAAHPPTALAMGEPALALVGLLLGWRWGRGAGRDPSGAWAEVVRAGFALPALHDAMYRHALVPLGRALGWLDRYVVDGLVNAVAAATWRITAPLRAADRGSLAWTFAGIWLGWLGLWWWLR
jgi:NADH-quinone oxidoreductase subunit L